MKRLIVGMVLVGAALPAQDQKDARAALARAVVIEEQELDVARAVAEYRRLAGDATVPDELRAQARLRLGMALLRTGQEAEGSRLLEELARGGGELAERARGALAADQVHDQTMQRRVEAAVQLMRTDVNKGREELTFLGAAAAPALGKLLLTLPFDRELLTNGVSLLLQLDAAEAERTLLLLREQDVFVRRAAARGLWRTGRTATDAAVLAFLRDPDEDVRATATRGLAAAMAVEELLPYLAEASDGVRRAAFEGLLRVRGDRRAALLPVAEQELARAAPATSLWAFTFDGDQLRNAPTIDFALRALRHPACHARVQSIGRVEVAPNECLDQAVATAEALGPLDQRDFKRGELGALVRACEDSWDERALAKRLRLLRLGYGSVVKWLANRVATPELVGVVLEHLEGISLRETALGQLLSKWPIPPERWRALADVAVARAKDATTGPDPEAARDVDLATRLATATLHPDAMEWVAQFAPTDVHAFHGAVHALSALGDLPPPARAALVALATADVDFERWQAVPRHEFWEPFDWLSNLCSLVARHGMDAGADWFVRAHRDGSQPNVLQVLFPSREREVRLRDETVASILKKCLALGRPDVLAQVASQVQQASSLVVPVYRTLCEFAVAALREPRPSQSLQQLVGSLVSKRVDPNAGEKVLIEALAHEDRDVGRAALNNVSKAPRLSHAAVAALAERLQRDGEGLALHRLAQHAGPAQVELIASFLKHDDPQLRTTAVSALASMRDVDVVDRLVPTFADPSASVRLAACYAAARLRDRRLAPAMVECLRDPDEKVREQAKTALEATEFYVDQVERWQRLLHGSGLEANTAAEALLRQSKAGNDKRIRLAAIGGLGALGVKETLPLLIQLMQDPDAEIAAAASAAVAALSK